MYKAAQSDNTKFKFDQQYDQFEKKSKISGMQMHWTEKCLKWNFNDKWSIYGQCAFDFVFTHFTFGTWFSCEIKTAIEKCCTLTSYIVQKMRVLNIYHSAVILSYQLIAVCSSRLHFKFFLFATVCKPAYSSNSS